MALGQGQATAATGAQGGGTATTEGAEGAGGAEGAVALVEGATTPEGSTTPASTPSEFDVSTLIGNTTSIAPEGEGFTPSIFSDIDTAQIATHISEQNYVNLTAEELATLTEDPSSIGTLLNSTAQQTMQAVMTTVPQMIQMGVADAFKQLTPYLNDQFKSLESNRDISGVAKSYLEDPALAPVASSIITAMKTANPKVTSTEIDSALKKVMGSISVVGAKGASKGKESAGGWSELFGLTPQQQQSNGVKPPVT